jgi:hypothetical protein
MNCVKGERLREDLIKKMIDHVHAEGELQVSHGEEFSKASKAADQARGAWQAAMASFLDHHRACGNCSAQRYP